MRLFFAIELPAEVQSQLGGLKPVDENREYRWVDPSLLHVTLAFLGEQPEQRLPLLEEVGASAASAGRTGTLQVGRPGDFGPKRAPRVLWVDIAGEVQALLSLQVKLAAGLRHAGFQLEDRPFTPHITLARRRETARGGSPDGWPPRIEPRPFTMDRLTLFQSRLSPRGPTYIPLSEFQLRG